MSVLRGALLGREIRLHRDAENAIQFIRLPVSQNCRYDGGFFSQTNNLIINTNNCPLKVHLRELYNGGKDKGSQCRTTPQPAL
jgi:hypothetical protein